MKKKEMIEKIRELQAIVNSNSARIHNLQDDLRALQQFINFTDDYKIVSFYEPNPPLEDWECLPVVDCDLKFFKKKKEIK